MRTGQSVDLDSTGAQAAAQPETRAEPIKTKYMPKEPATSPIKQSKNKEDPSDSDREDTVEGLHVFHIQEIVTAFAGLACDGQGMDQET